MPRALEGLRALGNLRGFLVTMTHKEAIVPLLDRITQGARIAGAVNIVRRHDDGALEGGQLDGAGFVAAMGLNSCPPAGRQIAVVGAGGVAAGICHPLAQAGAARVDVVNRTASQAEALVERLSKAFSSCKFTVASAVDADIEIAINATSLGMREADPAPFDVERLMPGTYVGDVVNRPGETALLNLARKRGMRAQNGQEMVMPLLALMHAFFGNDA